MYAGSNATRRQGEVISMRKRHGPCGLQRAACGVRCARPSVIARESVPSLAQYITVLASANARDSESGLVWYFRLGFNSGFSTQLFFLALVEWLILPLLVCRLVPCPTCGIIFISWPPRADVELAVFGGVQIDP